MPIPRATIICLGNHISSICLFHSELPSYHNAFISPMNSSKRFLRSTKLNLHPCVKPVACFAIETPIVAFNASATYRKHVSYCDSQSDRIGDSPFAGRVFGLGIPSGWPSFGNGHSPLSPRFRFFSFPFFHLSALFLVLLPISGYFIIMAVLFT